MVTSMISSPIPTAPGLPLVGNALAYRRNRLALWMQVRETCGDIGLVRLGSRSLLLVSSPELIHAVLVEQADHCPGFPPSATDQFGPLDGSSNRTPPEPVVGWGRDRPCAADDAADPGDILRPRAVEIRSQQ